MAPLRLPTPRGGTTGGRRPAKGARKGLDRGAAEADRPDRVLRVRSGVAGPVRTGGVAHPVAPGRSRDPDRAHRLDLGSGARRETDHRHHDDVADVTDETAWAPELEAAGYRQVIREREPEWWDHAVLKGPDTNVNLHVFSAGCNELERMVGFRDWLRSHPDDRELYELTKRELIGREWTYVQEYADQKTEVVAAITARAGLPAGRP